MYLAAARVVTWSTRPRSSSLCAQPLRRTLAPLHTLRLPTRHARRCNEPTSSSSNALKITEYWQSRLRELAKPQVLSILPQLSTENSLCFVNKLSGRGSLVDFAVQQKELRPDMLLLIRVGEFYDDKTAAAALRLYREDFEILGYPTALPLTKPR